jgi:hypothetical protein
VGVGTGAAPVFEVLDDPDEAPADGFPASSSLQWSRVADAASYRVEAYDGADWNEVASVDDDGGPYYRWDTGPLADAATHDFRVVAVGTNGVDGTAAPFAILMVRHPDPPAFTLEYDPGTGLITFDLE